MTTLELLLALQERDLALDRLRHRRDTLPERDALIGAESGAVELVSTVAALRAQRDDIVRDEQRLSDEVSSLSEQAAEAERRLYSGEIASPRELQALQADVEQLRRRQRSLEDQQLSTMERREPIEERLAAAEAELATAEADVEVARGALSSGEAAIDAEAATETSARDEVSGGLDDDLLEDYEQRRAKANGVGAARLVGNTCQGCHLSIPATEVDRIRKGAGATVEYCDNCGCILVP